MPSPPGAPPPGAGASRAESATVNAAGLVQGIALVTFPAPSTISRVLPGARYRRHLYWRYSLVWTKPS